MKTSERGVSLHAFQRAAAISYLAQCSLQGYRLMHQPFHTIDSKFLVIRFVRPGVSPPSIRWRLRQPNPACCLRSGDLDSNKPHLLESVVSTTRLGYRLFYFP